jgi:hypothetical protein
VERGLPNYEGACESLRTPNSGVEGEWAAERQVKSALRTWWVTEGGDGGSGGGGSAGGHGG